MAGRRSSRSAESKKPVVKSRVEATPASPADTEGSSLSEPAAPLQCLTFFVAGEEYAASILSIREIVEYAPLTRVPTVPDWVHGVLNLRGSVVPVLDVACRFERETTRVGPRTCIVVAEVDIEGEPSVLGLLVDAVGRVVDVPSDAVRPVPQFGAGVGVDCLAGMVSQGSSLIPILAVERILSTAEILQGAALPTLTSASAGESQSGSRVAALASE